MSADVSVRSNPVFEFLPLPRETIECPDLATAREIRRRYPDVVVHGEDDARTCEVVITLDAPERVISEIYREAEAAWDEQEERFGQVPLTLSERRRIDFTETNTFHARSCKAIAEGKGEPDWLAWYDVELSVDEHREVYSRATGRGVSLRETPSTSFPDGRAVVA